MKSKPKRFVAGQEVEVQAIVGGPWVGATYETKQTDMRGHHSVRLRKPVPSEYDPERYTNFRIVPTRRIRHPVEPTCCKHGRALFRGCEECQEELPTLEARIASAHERIEAERKCAVKSVPRPRDIEALDRLLADAWDTINDISMLVDPSAIADERRKESIELVNERSASRRLGGGNGRIGLGQAVAEASRKL